MLVLGISLLGLLNHAVTHRLHVDPYLEPNIHTSPHEDDFTPLYKVTDDEEVSDDLAIQVEGGTQEAIQLAHKYGLHYLDQVFENPAIYHLHKVPQNNAEDRPRRDTSGEVALLTALSHEPKVRWVKQQIAYKRVTRRFPTYKNSYRKSQEAHIQIPGDVMKSKMSLKRVLFRHSDPVSQTKTTPNKGRNESFLKYTKAITDSIGARDNQRMHKPKTLKDQNWQSPMQENSKGGLARVPLTRNIGYSIDQAKENVRLHSQETLQDQSYGKIYIPRDRQLKIDIEMLPESNSIDTGPVYNTIEDFDEWLDHLKNTEMNFNDPLYLDQWYLHNTGQLGHLGYDLNVTWAWLKGYTGQGIVTSVLDDGIQTTNPDISNNYLPSISYSLIRDGRSRSDPSPRLDPKFTNSHGTYCAAIIAAVHNNNFCGVGVAYNAQVGGVRIVDGKVTDIQEATALSRHIDRVDVFSASWGPTDDGTKVEGPDALAQHAFIEGVTKGRNGKGVIYAWASGNGGIAGDNCNLDGYASSIYTLSVSALTDAGTSTFYEEPCASTIAGIYIGGYHSIQTAKKSVKKNFMELLVVVPELDGHCSKNFQGTSAAAPLMAGIVALVLEANGNLTWRDVQYIVADTSSPTPQALMEPGWHTNGIGKRFHLKQGFGAVNAGKMVEAAAAWENVPTQKIVVLPMFNGYRDFRPDQWLNITRDLDTTEIPLSESMRTVEHVVANITISHPERKLLTIFIVSPSGTTSQVLTHRNDDNSTAGFKSWGFMSVHFWGENPIGTWTVALKSDSGKNGYLMTIETTIYGS
ncbi:hypothetical protein SK128_015082 [Halocaridina rubra]|uniref:P/Homo B domain-containing protein n=1 Tax=Halocaridina rubra TaxID=373956 RepID=A0AAN9A670_HALRR